MVNAIDNETKSCMIVVLESKRHPQVARPTYVSDRCRYGHASYDSRDHTVHHSAHGQGPVSSQLPPYESPGCICALIFVYRKNGADTESYFKAVYER
jgi:hypothetical protein